MDAQADGHPNQTDPDHDRDETGDGAADADGRARDGPDDRTPDGEDDTTDHERDDHERDDHERDDHDLDDHDLDDHDHDDHGHHDHDLTELCLAVLTISSTRTIEDDAAGDAIVEAVEDAGHEVVVRELVNDSYDGIQQTVDRFVDREDTDYVVTTGGTGVTPDDVTIEAVEPLLDKQLPGFGELFRTLSYEEVGTRVVCTRATAGVSDGVGVFCLPGSEDAARLGTREIVVEESPHLVGLARQDGEHPR